MSDYPDHLNPFNKRRSGGLRESFRSIKTAIGGRFRKKKDHHGERHSQQVTGVNNPAGTLLRQNGTSTMPRSETMGTPEMFPRSRFTERVARAQTMEFRTAANPFDDDADAAPVKFNGRVVTENGMDSEKKRRRKKRAPLPPGARAGDRLTVPGDHHSSQWSIESYTSYDTDYSTTGTVHTHSENEDGQPESAERLKDIQEISKEIQVYCDDKDEKDSTTITVTTITSDETITTSDSTDTDATDTQTEVIPLPESELSETIKDKDATETSTPDIDINELPKSTEEVLEHVEKEEINNNQIQNVKVAPPVVTVSNDEIDQTNLEVLQTNDVEGNVENEENEVKNTTDCDIQKQPKEEDISNGPTDNSLEEVSNIDENSKDIAYVNRKSIFIAGSTDNLEHLDQTSETTLFITGSCDQLDGSGSGAATEAAPTPKIRKHKLGRDVLLGSRENGLNSSDKQ